MSHGIDLVPLVHRRPLSNFVRRPRRNLRVKDGRRLPTRSGAARISKGTFSSATPASFGNDAPSFSRYMGKKSTLFQSRGEGKARVTSHRGKRATTKTIPMSPGSARTFLASAGQCAPPMGIDDMSTGHMSNWFDCMRSPSTGRHRPATGFAHRWPA